MLPRYDLRLFLSIGEMWIAKVCHLRVFPQLSHDDLATINTFATLPTAACFALRSECR